MTEARFISDYYRRVFATLELSTVCKTYQEAILVVTTLILSLDACVVSPVDFLLCIHASIDYRVYYNIVVCQQFTFTTVN